MHVKPFFYDFFFIYFARKNNISVVNSIRVFGKYLSCAVVSCVVYNISMCYKKLKKNNDNNLDNNH